MSKALVSIALCTYNGEKYLPEQLESLLAQDYPEIEIIALDDGSKDNTLAILKTYEAKYPQLKVYQNTENLGYVKNFEKAISLCNGEYIALADQDDIWDSRKISLQVAKIGSYSLIYHDSAFVDEEGKATGGKVSDIRNFYTGTDASVFLLENCVSGHSLLFKRELLVQLAPFNPIVFHDWWLVYIACHQAGICYIDECLVKYRQHQNASTDLLKSKKRKGPDSLAKIEKEFAILQLFHSLNFKNQNVLNQLLVLYQHRMHAYFSFGLAFFIFKHRKSLLFLKKKSRTSKLNLISKYLWGYKLKKLFN